MEIRKFEDIIARQKARGLVLLCYKTFGSLRDYSFKDQALRAAISVMNNVAEGYERRGDKKLKKFFYIAKDSAGEVRPLST